jgi:hypothetical protein
MDSRVEKIIVHPGYARLNNDVGKFHNTDWAQANKFKDLRCQQ